MNGSKKILWLLLALLVVGFMMIPLLQSHRGKKSDTTAQHGGHDKHQGTHPQQTQQAGNDGYRAPQIKDPNAFMLENSKMAAPLKPSSSPVAKLAIPTINDKQVPVMKIGKFSDRDFTYEDGLRRCTGNKCDLCRESISFMKLADARKAKALLDKACVSPCKQLCKEMGG